MLLSTDVFTSLVKMEELNLAQDVPICLFYAGLLKSDAVFTINGL